MQLHRAPEWLLPSAILCLVHHTRPEFCWKWGGVLQRTAFSNASTRFIPRASPSCAWNRAGVLQGKKTQHISMWLNTIKLRGFLTRGQKEICKDKLSFDNPWLGTATLEKNFIQKKHSPLLEIRNGDIRLTMAPTKKPAVGLKSPDAPCSFCEKVISNWLQMWNHSLHGN